MIRSLVFLSLVPLITVACGNTTMPAPSNLNNTPFPRVQGRSLNETQVTLPDSYLGKPTLVLVGYVQKAQFDIDRWILGALQANIKAQIVEVPTIAGMVPRMVQGYIDSGMRSGIPQSDWGSVVTVYEDAPAIIEALGNERPNVARAVLLDKNGTIVWSSNAGYSATQILELEKVVNSLHN